jgi:hypothetical protein
VRATRLECGVMLCYKYFGLLSCHNRKVAYALDEFAMSELSE